MPRLSIITISFNTSVVTQNCLQSLHEATDISIGQDTEVIVVDNGSCDDSVEAIRQRFPLVNIVETGENLGFSKGNNRGVAVNTSSDYVLFLNSDTIVPTGALSAMARYMDEHTDVGLASCKVVLADGSLDWDSHRGFPTPWVSVCKMLKLNEKFPKSKLFNGYNQGWKDMNAVHEVDSLVGAFMFVRRSVGDDIRWWDEEYFLNGEDIDFSYRVKELGHKVMYVPTVSITHLRGVSKGTRKEGEKLSSAKREGKILVANASVDAMSIFYNKHLRKKYPWVMNTVVDLALKFLRWQRVRKIG